MALSCFSRLENNLGSMRFLQSEWREASASQADSKSQIRQLTLVNQEFHPCECVTANFHPFSATP